MAVRNYGVQSVTIDVDTVAKGNVRSAVGDNDADRWVGFGIFTYRVRYGRTTL